MSGSHKSNAVTNRMLARRIQNAPILCFMVVSLSHSDRDESACSTASLNRFVHQSLHLRQFVVCDSALLHTLIGNDFAVTKPDNALRMFGDILFMRHHDHRFALTM